MALPQRAQTRTEGSYRSDLPEYVYPGLYADLSHISVAVPLTSSELFVLFGNGLSARLIDLCVLTPLLDGSDLSQLSRKYNVHVSVKPNPLAIYLEGSRGSVRDVETYVDGVKKASKLIYSCLVIYSSVSRTSWRTPSKPLSHSLSHRRSFRRFHAFLGPSWRILVTRK